MAHFQAPPSFLPTLLMLQLCVLCTSNLLGYFFHSLPVSEQRGTWSPKQWSSNCAHLALSLPQLPLQPLTSPQLCSRSLLPCCHVWHLLNCILWFQNIFKTVKTNCSFWFCFPVYIHPCQWSILYNEKNTRSNIKIFPNNCNYNC